MPTRPKIWIHRTRRFWWGLVLWIVLTAAFVGSGMVDLGAQLTRSRWSSESGTPMIELKTIFLSIRDGGVTVAHHRKEVFPFVVSSPGAEWLFRSSIHASGYRWLPTRNPISSSFEGNVTFFPLWPLPVLWLIIWLTRMVRAERREAKAYAD